MTQTAKKKSLIRTIWTVVLIWQLITYSEAFPILLARVTRQHLPGNEIVNVVCYDLIGVGAWCMLLVFLEDRPFRGSKLMDYIGIGAFALLTTCIVLTSLGVWQ